MEINTDCVIHFEGKNDSEKRTFTKTTFEKFSLCRQQWLSLHCDYKSFASVAKRSLDRIPIGTNDVTELNNSNSRYHIGCYQLFTNLSKFERARQYQKQQQQQQQQQHLNPEPQRSSRRLNSNTEPISSGSVLPRICIICKRAGSIYVTDNKVR